MGGHTVLEAWPLAPASARSRSTPSSHRTGGRTVDGSLFVIERGTGEIGMEVGLSAWHRQASCSTPTSLWSAFRFRAEALEMRYIGFEVPPDDVADARLKQPNV